MDWQRDHVASYTFLWQCSRPLSPVSLFEDTHAGTQINSQLFARRLLCSL